MTRTNPELVTKIGNANFARLRELGKKHNIGADKVAQRFALEAAIRRIFTSDHADRFGVASLKGGALMFLTEGVSPIEGRTTTDIDIQLDGFEGTMDDLATIMRDVLADTPALDDGFRFDVEGLKVLGTRDGGVPGGAVTCVAQLGNTVVKFKCDVGFYDYSHKETLEEADYESLLPGQLLPVRIWRQPVEYGIADKIHAAVQHQAGNTRMRDYYDLYVACTRYDIDDAKLTKALLASWPLYAGTSTPPPIDRIVAYAAAFATANERAWQTMKTGWRLPVPDLAEVCKTIRDSIGPVLADINNPSLRAVK